MDKHSKLQCHGGLASQVAAATNLLLPRKSLSKHNPASIRSRENPDCTTPRRPPPCRTCRHSAAAPPYTIRRSETTKSGPLAGCLTFTAVMTQCAGASPHPPLDLLLTLVPTQKTPHAGALTRPPQYFVSWIRSLNNRQDDEYCCPAFQDPPQTAEPCPLVDRIALHHPRHSHRRHTSKPSCRLRRLSTMYHTPKSPSNAEQPATVCCKPSRPMMLVLQAPPSDAVPRRTDSYQATPAAAVRCQHPHRQSATTPGCH